MLNTNATRRGFLNLLTGLVLAILGLLVLIPALVYLFAPLRRRGGAAGSEPAFLDVGPVSALPIGAWRLLSLEVVREDGWGRTRTRHAIWVRRQGKEEREITVLSSICPHLGCPVNWHPDQSEFVCPCHTGRFDTTGRHIGGPPPRSMDPLEFEVRAGRLRVRWQDFKIGVAERIPVSL